MEMERIDENTIRVILGNDDLAERGVTVLDLLGSHQQIEKFFYSILEEVDSDHLFNDDDAVTFQVMPNKNGLEVLISRLTDDDNSSESDDDRVKSVKKRQPTNKKQLADLKKKLQSSDQDDDDDLTRYLDDGEVDYKRLVLKLPDFEAMIQLADLMRFESGISTLYRYQGAYYLELVFFVNEMHEVSAEDAMAIASEYGDKSTLTGDVLEEYGEKIMDQVALETTRHYFLS